jgi:hypothetical protein
MSITELHDMGEFCEEYTNPQNSGASQRACNIVCAIWSLDGMAPIRADVRNDHLAASVARMVDSLIN